MPTTPFAARVLGFSLIAVSWVTHGAEPAIPARPFPQHTPYAKDSIRPENFTQDALDQETSASYATWKRLRLKPAKPSGDLYVAFDAGEPDDDTLSVSEGHGYGMILTAFMAGHDPDAQRCFDGLYRFYKSHPSKNQPRLMSWRQSRSHSKKQDSAADGDLDIAYALLLADRQWGSQGAVPYLQEAKEMIAAILRAEINTATWSVRLGDDIGMDDSAAADIRSSDLMPDHFRAFERATGRSEWKAVRETGYGIVQSIQTAHSPQTGLLPDFICHVQKTPAPARPKYLESKHDGAFYYNACRFPFRIGLDYLISGEPRSKEALGKVNGWIRQKTGRSPANIMAGYTLSGQEIDREQQLCFLAPLAVSAMVDAENQAWLNALSTLVVPSPKEDPGYFDSTIRLLCLIVLSGNWWSP